MPCAVVDLQSVLFVPGTSPQPSTVPGGGKWMWTLGGFFTRQWLGWWRWNWKYFLFAWKLSSGRGYGQCLIRESRRINRNSEDNNLFRRRYDKCSYCVWKSSWRNGEVFNCVCVIPAGWIVDKASWRFGDVDGCFRCSWKRSGWMSMWRWNVELDEILPELP